jgi:hypothetical protein
MKYFLVIQSIKLKMDLCNSKDEAGLESYGVGVSRVASPYGSQENGFNKAR